jgi:Protein of unknown function (DUF3102)
MTTAEIDAADRINAALKELEATKDERKEVRSQISAQSKEAMKAVDKLDESILQKAYELGALLNQQKEIVGHGNWGKWLKVYCNRSHRSVNDYMQLAEWRERIEAYSQQELGAAISSIRKAKEIIESLQHPERGDDDDVDQNSTGQTTDHVPDAEEEEVEGEEVEEEEIEGDNVSKLVKYLAGTYPEDIAKALKQVLSPAARKDLAELLLAEEPLPQQEAQPAVH